MPGTSTIAGGAKHGLAVLSHNERSAAEHVLSRLGSAHNPASSATVFGGAKASAFGHSALLHGSDTFIGGARSSTTHSLAHVGSDTVISGSASSTVRAMIEGSTAHGAHSFGLNRDTISVKGATAEGVRNQQPETAAAAGSHTITLADKTTVTIAGLSKHDIGKISH